MMPSDPTKHAEYRNKIRERMIGYCPSKETRKKIGDANRGHRHTEDTKKRIAEALKRRPPSSMETRQKISDALTGKRRQSLSEEHRRKLSIAGKGKHPSELCIKRAIECNTGKHFSEEHRKKLSKNHWDTSSENNPAWKGGISFEPYCPKFTREFRERVRKFFKYTCQCCGHVWQPGERKLAVHHVNYDKMVCCNDVKPLFVPVCIQKGCHAKTNHNREYWEDIFTNKIMLEHDGECFVRELQQEKQEVLR